MHYFSDTLYIEKQLTSLNNTHTKLKFLDKKF